MRSCVLVLFLLCGTASSQSYGVVTSTTSLRSSRSTLSAPVKAVVGDTLQVIGERVEGYWYPVRGLAHGSAETWTSQIAQVAFRLLPDSTVSEDLFDEMHARRRAHVETQARQRAERREELRQQAEALAARREAEAALAAAERALEAAASALAKARADSAFYADTPDILLYRISTRAPYGSPEVTVYWGQHNPRKTVKYLRLWMSPYNRVGDPLRDPFGTREKELYLTGPVEASPEITSAYWEHVWFDINATCMKVRKVKVEYVDGSSYTYIRELPSILADGFENSCTIDAQERARG